MTEALALRSTLNPKPSLNDLVVKACALALREFPRMNGSYTEAGFELHEQVNVGIAVATDDGLVVPTIPDADSKSLAEIAALARELAAKVRDRKISLPELEGGTFTVTNLGMFGIRRFLPILNPPQAGILAAGAASKRPLVDERGSVIVRDLMNVTLVCDHRIVYGAGAARFLARVKELLEAPEQLAA
jgi:pyruvate dehydrogenase E2 component (dihydrolipoyllysine-residue acetyltransferase)